MLSWSTGRYSWSLLAAGGFMPGLSWPCRPSVRPSVRPCNLFLIDCRPSTECSTIASFYSTLQSTNCSLARRPTTRCSVPCVGYNLSVCLSVASTVHHIYGQNDVAIWTCNTAVADCDLALTILTFSRLFQSITDRDRDESKQLINETAGNQISKNYLCCWRPISINKQSVLITNKKAQLSLTNPREKLLQFDVLTTLSLTILVYLHSFSWTGHKSVKSREILIQTYRVQGHPRSSILVSIDSAYATSY